MPRVSQCRNSEYGKVPNKAGFSKCERYTAYWICKNMPWQSPGFGIWKSSGYARITQDSKYATIRLNMSEFLIIDRVLNMHHAIHSARPLQKLMSTYWEIMYFHKVLNMLEYGWTMMPYRRVLNMSC